MTDAAHNAEHPPLKVGAVLLAAGAGSRLGGRAKSLLELDGIPLIRRMIDALREASAHPIVVVLGHYSESVAAAVRDLPVDLICNPSPDDGQATSLRLGLGALGSGPDAIIIALADQPLITGHDIRGLMSAFRQRAGRQMVVPRVDGKPGNPVVLDAALRDELLADSAATTGQQWRRDNPERVYWHDSDNHHYRIDIDTPDDIARFVDLTGHTLSWPPP